MFAHLCLKKTLKERIVYFYFLILFFEIMCVVCACRHILVHMSVGTYGGQKMASRAVVTGGCEPFDLGTGNQTEVLCKDSPCI